MATSGKDKQKREKVFTFKKRDTSVVVEEVLIDDDDDFKPSRNPFPASAPIKANVAEKQHFRPDSGKSKSQPTLSSKMTKKKLPVGIKQLGSTKIAGDCYTVKELQSDFVDDELSSSDSSVVTHQKINAASSSIVSKNVKDEDDNQQTGVKFKKDEIEEILLDEQENCDVTLLENVNVPAASTSNHGKDAWQALMGQMQQNQKGIGPKRAKPSTKRGLTQSPTAKAAAACGKVDQIHSPVKKNVRLGSGEVAVGTDTGSTIASSALHEFKNGTYSRTQPNPLTSTSVPSSSTQLLLEETPSLTNSAIAPIFLPPAQRKALQKSSSIKSDTKNLFESTIDFDSQSQTCDLPENPAHFNGNTVILNHCQPDKDPYEGNKTKVCPFYKKLPGTTFCVDAFNYGLIPGMQVYFLSHFHSDHYIGLTKKFCKTVICTHSTGNLVRMKLYVEEKCIRKLNLNKPYLICDSEVTLVDANHCPGSVMFIFRTKTNTILHTGDFRYEPSMLTSVYLSGLQVDTLYLDTTYCSPQYDFPTQSDSVANVISHVKRHLEYRPQTLIVCGSYLIGKERVYFNLAEAIGSKVFGTFDKRKIINALENKRFSSLLSADENSQIHVVPMFSISAKNLQEYLTKYPQYTNIVGIKPSGWQFSSCGSGCSVKTHYNATVTVLGVPYSEHSSFSELREFVTNLKPKRVQPTVNVGNPKKRGEMMQYIESWLSK